MKKEKNSDMEFRKIELIRLRIKNKFYQKEEVLEKVVTEILNKSKKKNAFTK